ncbi:MAG: tRNA (guanosine(37)-N1)-methyltransferase TrmD [Peptococcaceae bacterium]|jgi:tRNA (guanine37-N1)-methyltransferase|nr:tRNA (guanosine(37)-N1)-methyltransferase TrmD [Peptococcaceae bacterium]
MKLFTVLTLFPEMFAPVRESILKRAQQAGKLKINVVNFRDYALSKHKNVDDIPYGGGAGMVLKPEPLYAAVRALPESAGRRSVILLTPQGRVFDQALAAELSQYDELVFICGHYEGYDERVRSLADEEISVGDFVVTGGELPAMIMIDAVSRLWPGVLGDSLSVVEESHSGELLEYPHYTRPPEFAGLQVPEVLLSGHHANIARWRRKEAWRRTFLRRPEIIEGILERLLLSGDDYLLLEELAREMPTLAELRERWQFARPPLKARKNRRAGKAEQEDGEGMNSGRDLCGADPRSGV